MQAVQLKTAHVAGVLFAQGFHSGCHRVSGRPRQHLALPLRRLRERRRGVHPALHRGPITAGLPFLLMDYALGHRNRGSAPLSFARADRRIESVGWWQVGICFMIAVYYAAVIAGRCSTRSSPSTSPGVTTREFPVRRLPAGRRPGVSASVVMRCARATGGGVGRSADHHGAGCAEGIGATAVVFIPLLILAFTVLVVRSLFLPGAAQGLDALFSPNWSAPTQTSVWAAAFGQIFFSLSVGFGIMVTYASYVAKRTDMTGSGLVVGLSNSVSNCLPASGVRRTGLRAQASRDWRSTKWHPRAWGLPRGLPDDHQRGPAGALIGVLFFGSLVFAGLTSLVSVIEVVISAVRDKFELTRLSRR